MAAGLLLVGGCMSWTPGWRSPLLEPSARDVGDAEAALERAEALLESADSASRLRQAIAAYDEALRFAPDSGEVLVHLAEAHVLYGAAYSDERRDKAHSYLTGIRYAEQALALNPGFRRRVEAGESVGEATVELGRDELRPMLFWVTGVSYYYKECLGGLGHLTQFRWMLRTREVMDRMMALDPAYEHGAVPFSLAIYFIGLPASAGRDLTRSADLLAQAVAESPTSLLTRWGRAKYLHVKTRNRAAFRRDLEWVMAQDPTAADSPLRWNVYFQRDARELLAQIEHWF
jgi:tetratricopeptide (TPR) repeat protein